MTAADADAVITFGGQPDVTGVGSFTGLAAGTYPYLLMSPGGCTKRDTVVVEGSLPLKLAPLADTLLCQGQGLMLNYDTLSRVQWRSSAPLACDTCLLFVIDSTFSGDLSLQAVNRSGCADSTSFTVTRPAAVSATLAPPSCEPYRAAELDLQTQHDAVRLNFLTLSQNRSLTADAPAGTHVWTAQQGQCRWQGQVVVPAHATVPAAETLSVCETTTTTRGGIRYVGAGDHEVILAAQAACDTLLALTLTPAYDTTLNRLDTVSAATGEFFYREVAYPTAGVYRIADGGDAYCPAYLDLALTFVDVPTLYLQRDTTLYLNDTLLVDVKAGATTNLRWDWTPSDLFNCSRLRTTRTLGQPSGHCTCECDGRKWLSLQRELSVAHSA